MARLGRAQPFTPKFKAPPVVSTASTASGDGSSAGVGAASGIGAATTNGVFSTSGAGAATGVGLSLFSGIASSDGVGVATGIGIGGSVASSSGAGDALGVGDYLGTAPSTVSGAPGGLYQNGYMAEINGVLRHFATLEDLKEFLASFTKKQKKKLRRRQVITKVEVPRIEIPAQTAQPAVELIQRHNASLEAYFWQQYELLAEAKRLQDEDDEEALIALFG